MLKFNDVSFGHKSQRNLLFSHLDWQLEAGGICGLLGPNGCSEHGAAVRLFMYHRFWGF